MPSNSVGAAVPDLTLAIAGWGYSQLGGVAFSELLDRSCAVWCQASSDFCWSNRDSEFGNLFGALRARPSLGSVCG